MHDNAVLEPERLQGLPIHIKEQQADGRPFMRIQVE
jgi:hypothetical protein